MSGSSHPYIFYKKLVLINLALFTEKNTCAGVSFDIKLQAEDYGTGLFCVFCKAFKKVFFIEHLPVTASILHIIFFFRTLDHVITDKCVTSRAGDNGWSPLP